MASVRDLKKRILQVGFDTYVNMALHALMRQTDTPERLSETDAQLQEILERFTQLHGRVCQGRGLSKPERAAYYKSIHREALELARQFNEHSIAEQ